MGISNVGFLTLKLFFTSQFSLNDIIIPTVVPTPDLESIPDSAFLITFHSQTTGKFWWLHTKF